MVGASSERSKPDEWSFTTSHCRNFAFCVAIPQFYVAIPFVEVDKDIYVRALLGVYEKNDISLIRDLYMWAYDRSSRQYTAVQRAIAEPNLLKLRYRIQIQEIIRSIILEKTRGDIVVARIRELIAASDVPEAEHNELFNIIENEIVSLHDGNIARFKVRPSEFQAWKEMQ